MRPDRSAGKADRALSIGLALLLALALGSSMLPPAASQSGGGSVNNQLPTVDADGTYTWGAEAFGDQGSIGPSITFNDGTPGNTYDIDGTANAALKWGEWAANPGALDVESGNGANQDGRYIKAVSSASSAAVELFVFEVFDSNGEADIATVRVSSDDATFNGFADEAGSGHPVTGAELAQTAKPGTGAGIDSDGYAVWNPTANDGYVSVQFRYTWPAGQTAGTYTQKAHAADEGAERTAPTPADDDTTVFPTSATATLDFSNPQFDGQTDPAYNVDIDANIDFHWVVVASPAPDPSVLTFDQSSLNDADGAIAISLNAAQTTWVYYDVDIKDTAGGTVIKDQTYASAFTWA